MSRSSAALAIILVAVLCAGGGLFAGYHVARRGTEEKADTTAPDETPSGEAKPVAMVQMGTISAGTVMRNIVAYGTVVTQPGVVAVYSVPFECRVGRLNSAAGQPTSQGMPLITITPSPDAQLQYQEAKITLAAAKRDLSQTQERFNSKLATVSDLSQAQQVVNIAELHLKNDEDRGLNKTSGTTLTATSSGVVSKIDVQVGQIVPAGQPLVETIAANQIEVRLGVEPAQVATLKDGQEVKLFAMGTDAGDGIRGKIRLITQRVDPDTRLVDVFVSPTDKKLMLDSFIRAQLMQTSPSGLVVPRSAVLPDDEGNLLFTVKDGHAVKHVVNVLFESNEQTLISADGIAAGDPIVVVGNYELEDGMSVVAQAPPTTGEATSGETPTTTESPTTAEAPTTTEAPTTAETPPTAAAATAPITADTATQPTTAPSTEPAQ
ncbi:MAG: efflux RND transporter periplasmic adaptor subunit [Phycisphaerae bacterium]|nr:efflux RND transporter periplasmic adaptor subunit [Phycisphaerae bacterium]